MEYLSKNDDLAKAANYLNEGLRKSASQYHNDYLKVICRYDGEFIASINELLSKSFEELEKNLNENDPADPSAYFTRVGYVIQAGKSKNRKFVTKIHGDLLFQLRKVENHKFAHLLKFPIQTFQSKVLRPLLFLMLQSHNSFHHLELGYQMR